MFSFFKPDVKKLFGEKLTSVEDVFKLMKERGMTNTAVKSLEERFNNLKGKMTPEDIAVIEGGIAMWWDDFRSDKATVTTQDTGAED